MISELIDARAKPVNVWKTKAVPSLHLVRPKFFIFDFAPESGGT
jgi:hypothetical protein